MKIQLLLFSTILIILSGCSNKPINKLDTRILIDPGEKSIGSFDYNPFTDDLYYNKINSVDSKWFITFHRTNITSGETVDIVPVDNFVIEPNYPPDFISILKDGEVVGLIGDRLLFFEQDAAKKEIPVSDLSIPELSFLSETYNEDYEKKKNQCNEKLTEIEDLVLQNGDFQTIGYEEAYIYKNAGDATPQIMPRYLLFSNQENPAFDTGTLFSKCSLDPSESFITLVTDKDRNLSLYNYESESQPYSSTSIIIKDKKFEILESRKAFGSLVSEQLCEMFMKEITLDNETIWRTPRSCPAYDVIFTLPASRYVFINENEFIYQAGLGHGMELIGTIVASRKR